MHLPLHLDIITSLMRSNDIVDEMFTDFHLLLGGQGLWSNWYVIRLEQSQSMCSCTRKHIHCMWTVRMYYYNIYCMWTVRMYYCIEHVSVPHLLLRTHKKILSTGV